MEKLTREKKLEILKFEREIGIWYPDEIWKRKSISGYYTITFLNSNDVHIIKYKTNYRNNNIQHETIYTGPFDYLVIKQIFKNNLNDTILEESQNYRHAYYSRQSRYYKKSGHEWKCLKYTIAKRYDSIEKLFDMEELFTELYWSKIDRKSYWRKNGN